MINEDWGNIIHDDAAYEKLYTDNFKKFYNYGKKFTTNTSIIEDSIQETFLQIWTNKIRLKEVTSINGYFFSSFRYKLLRKIKEERKIISSEPFENDTGFTIELDFINREVDRQLQLKLKNALDILTPHQREAIFLRFYQNLSYEDVADILNISVKSTYKIMARSLSALKESMPCMPLLLLLTAIM